MGDKRPSFVSRHRGRLVSFAICFSIVGLCAGLLWRHYRRGGQDDLVLEMENRLLDFRFQMRGPRKPSGKVGILAIDERSLQRFGRWPISRKYYEQAFKNLKRLGVQWVGFDVVWSQPELPQLIDVEPQLSRLSSLATSANLADWRTQAHVELNKISKAKAISFADQAIARTIQDFSNVVLGFFYYASEDEAGQLGDKRFAGLSDMSASAIQSLIFPDKMSLGDYPALKSLGIVANSPYVASHAKHFAFFNNESDPDAIMRWVTLVRSMDGQLMPSLSLKTAAEMLGREIVVFFDQFGITDISLINPNNDQDLIKIPVDHHGFGRILINHLGPDKTMPHFSLVDAYDNSFTAEQRKKLKGMSMLLGPTAIAINDQRANPFDAGINGVEDHAAVIDNIASGRFMRRTENIYLTELLMVIGVGLLFAPLMIFGKAAVSGFGAASFLIGYYYFDKYFWFGRGEWVYMGMPFVEITTLFVGTTLYKYMTEEREKRKTRGVLSLYLSPEVTKQVLEDQSALKLGGEKKELTVFFSDVRSFTTISESLTPEKLCELMNDYFTPMTEIIQRTGGVLDKYIGDAIMAFWGAPVTIKDQADIACAAALEMLLALDKLRVDLPKKGFPMIDIGIGLNTGTMSVGNMGSPQRFCYTVMGDSVNLGSRLESLTKEYGIKVMISEFTRAKITRKDILVRDLDDIRVKGKNEPVKVFELLRPDLLKSPADVGNLIGEFELGRDAYRRQNWTLAKRHFEACLTIRPKDGPSTLYGERIAEIQQAAPLKDWDGVYTFKHK